MLAKQRLPVFVLLVLTSVTTAGDEPEAMTSGRARVRREPKVVMRVLPQGVDGFAEDRRMAAYHAAYRKASAEAGTALEEGRPCLYSYGMLGISDLDPETGLAVVPIAGCVVDANVLGRTEGNNNRVRAWFKEHGPTANSLVRWKDELSDLPAYFAARAKAAAAIALQVGGPTLTSPDGRFRLRQVAAQVERGIVPHRRKVTTIGLEVSERGVVREVLADYVGDGLTDLAWGPPGAPFAVVKYRDGNDFDFLILHLRPVDWVSNGELAWQRYLKEHPEVRIELNDPE
jgi:hypothetical protein